MKKLMLFLLLIPQINLFGQQEPQPQKIDEFQSPNCEEISARLDGFSIHLANNPTSIGFVVINGKRNDLRKNLVFEGMIKTYFGKRAFAKDLIVVRSSDADQLAIHFWMVPAGSKIPDVQRQTWSYKIDKSSKPSMFAWSDYDDDICPDVDTVKLLAEVLAANPNAHTNVVIRESSNRAYKRKRRNLDTRLTHEYGVSKNQIRFFKAATPNRRTIIWEADEEFWLVP